jgi:hypothetical protein
VRVYMCVSSRTYWNNVYTPPPSTEHSVYRTSVASTIPVCVCCLCDVVKAERRPILLLLYLLARISALSHRNLLIPSIPPNRSPPWQPNPIYQGINTSTQTQYQSPRIFSLGIHHSGVPTLPCRSKISPNLLQYSTLTSASA